VAYDVVFMDCQLPELDGLETAREIRRREQAQPASARRVYIIAMTAYALRGARDECLAAGMDDYLTKPVRLESLLAAMEKALPQRNASIEAPASQPGYAPPQTKEEILDPAVIANLRALHDGQHPNPAEELVDLFLQHAPLSIQEMELAAARYDAPELGRIAHALRGSSSSIGAVLLARRCAEIEEKAGSRALQEAAHLLSNLRTDFDETVPALKSFRNTL
jgi:DNA-binding NarL/FixJ family response regulator